MIFTPRKLSGGNELRGLVHNLYVIRAIKLVILGDSFLVP